MGVTVGIDLAAAPAGTAIAALRWERGGAVVDDLVTGADDEVVLRWMRHPDGAVGIDCPFGWPAAFVRMVTEHSARTLRTPADRSDGWRREYVLRQTDRHVHATTGLRPLSVAADYIGHVAIRLAALISELDPGVDSSLDGSGAIAETYPAAALLTWGLPHRGYKGAANQAPRDTIVDGLLTAAPWLDLGPHAAVVRGSDHALDAVLCALVARARQRGWTEGPSDVELARREGWIHVPTRPLADLP